MPRGKKLTMDERTAISKANGSAFGRLIALNNPGWTLENAQEMSKKLKPIAPALASVYRQAFVEAFERQHNFLLQKLNGDLENGNRFPQGEETMGRVADTKKKVSNATFVKAATLSQLQIPFTLLRIHKSKGQFGPQWYLKIRVYPDTLMDTDLGIENEKGIATVTLAEGGRDDQMEALAKEIEQNGPIHNCFLDSVPMENSNNVWYDIAEFEEGDEEYHNPREIEKEFAEQDEEQPQRRSRTNRTVAEKQSTSRTSKTLKGSRNAKDIDPFLPEDDDEEDEDYDMEDELPKAPVRKSTRSRR